MPGNGDLAPTASPDAITRRKRFSDYWHSTSTRDKALFGCILATGFVLIINLSIVMFLSLRNGVNQNLGDLYTRDCQNMDTINMVVHLFINILSSIVVAASNFCAQLLAAPTRAEVTDAHKDGKWLDVGTPSFRNLFGGRIATKRKLLWVGLAFSSVPLHLLSVLVLVPISTRQLANSILDGTLCSSLLSPWITTS